MISFPLFLSACLALLLTQPALLWAGCDHPTKDAKKAAIEQSVSQPSSTTPEETIQKKQVDLKILKQRLRKTTAIGFFTKLAIRNDLVDLIDEIKKYRKQSMLNDKLNEVRASFDGLILKLIALLDDDPDLSRDLYVGREMIWKSLLEEKA